MSPQRIQLSRAKGWRKPPDVIVVSRPSRFGNPFPAAFFGRDDAVRMYRDLILNREAWWDDGISRHRFTRWFHDARRHRDLPVPTIEQIREALAGRDLACWCPLDGPCHATVLLELANEGADR